MMKHTSPIMKLFVVAVVCMIGSSCSKSRNESAMVLYNGNLLNQYYNINFIKADSSTIVTASFTEALTGRPLVFPDRSLVTVNGVACSFVSRQVPDFFAWEIHDSIVAFILSDPKKLLINVVPLSSINDIILVMDSVLPVNDTMHVSFIGAPLGEDEHIDMAMYRNNDTSNGWNGVSYDFHSRQGTLDFSETKKLSPGTYTVTISRQKKMPLKQADGHAGGQILISITDRKTVVVK